MLASNIELVKSNAPDWIDKPLSELTKEQWESLCDGCGKCCMAKLQDEDTAKIYYTNVACELFDADKCRCTDYENRTRRVPDCISLSIQRPHEFAWLPTSCAYRLRFESKPLHTWHPLLTGNLNSTHEMNCSVKDRVISSKNAGPLEHHLVEWD